MSKTQQQNAARMGRAAQHLATAWLLRNNDVWVASLPDPSSVDLVVIPSSAPHKRINIQVKECFDARGKHRTVNVAKSSGIRYRPEELDYILAVDDELLMFWLIPLRTLKGQGRVRLGKKYLGYAFGWHDPCPVFGGWANGGD